LIKYDPDGYWWNKVKDIKDFEGLYAVTEEGRVWSYPKGVNANLNGLWLKPSLIGNTNLKDNLYYAVQLRKDGKSVCRRVHRLVAEVFLENKNNLPQVNHKNGDKTDNRVENLEWCSAQHNVSHFWATDGERPNRPKTYNK
jgi:hypothetical protein